MTAQPKHVLKSKIKNDELYFSKQVELFIIAVKMKKTGLADSFIVNAVKTALTIEAVADLMHMWSLEKDTNERDEIVADIQDLIDASLTIGSSVDYIKFNDLEKISKNIRVFKDSLYQEVIKRGGISNLAELTGIPQPSLSRFFNSNAMPQRATILKIANALNLHELEIDMKWHVK